MIGLLGASGAVGAVAAGLLAPHADLGLRLGSRRLDAVARTARDLPDAAGAVETTEVDAADEGSLAAFVHGCTVVVNCAGPSPELCERVALAAWAGGADCVDAGGDAATAVRLDDARKGADRRALLAAGAWPGLSGLVPRWLAASEFTAADALRIYIGVRDRFTPTAAADYLDGALGRASEPLAAWRDGRRPRTLTRVAGEHLPFFPDDMTALPYLDDEGEQLARTLGLTHGDWYGVLPARWCRDALDRSRLRSRADAIKDLRRAAEVDTAGRPGETMYLAQLDGRADGGPRTRTALLHGPGVSVLTGAVAAAATLAVLRGEVAPGARCAAAAIDPLVALPWVCRVVPCALTVLADPVEALRTVEEGAL